MTPQKDTLVDSHVSLNQCGLAIEALHAHTSKADAKAEETELLPGKEQFLWLQIAVKKTQAQKKHKPFKIPIAHPLVDPRSSAVCLITKDPQREYKDLLETHGIKFISRVIGITKLKGKFKPYEARRMLLKDHALFLADERVVPLLPGLLGSKWFDAKKQPIPVCLTRKDLKGELERAISSTYMHQNQGTCTSVKIATTAQTSTQALANLEKALPTIVSHIDGGWDNIQSLHIKTNDSVALPIWTCGLEDGNTGRWNGLVAGQESESEDEETAVEMPAISKVDPSPKAKGKGAKRPSEEEAEGAEKPKKKAKSEATCTIAASATSAESTSKKRKLQAVSDTSSAAPTKVADSFKVVEEPKKKKAKKGSVTTEAMAEAEVPAEPTAVTSPAAPPTAHAKKQKAKASSLPDADVQIAEIPAVAPTPSAEVMEAAPSLTRKKGKKQQKADAEPTAEVLAQIPADTTTLVATTVVEASVHGEKKKSKKKSKVSIEESLPTPETEATPLAPTSVPSTDGEKKKRRKSTGAAPLEDVDSTTVTVEVPAPAATADTPRKKTARVSFAEVLESSAPAPTFMTKGELKQKRSALSGEKKKDKVVSGGGKSAKDGILGRKPGRS
ncbi:hypothetical protein HWV62_38442 [Athelia sp. TMB]|nr:hypothetical protein HWV62_38442 [Athelia sp. TMB]